MKHTKLLAVLAATALACGGGTATSHNNAGTGTSTLLVTGAIEASMNNGAPVTNFTVTLRDGLGNRVPAATVTISNSGLPNGSVSLVEAQAGSGRYLNSIAQFPGGDFGLSVTRNTDNVQGVVVGGQHARSKCGRACEPAAGRKLDHALDGKASDDLDQRLQWHQHCRHRLIHNRRHEQPG